MLVPKIKVAYPEECTKVCDELKTLKSASSIQKAHKSEGEHIDKVLDDLSKHGLIERKLKRVGEHDMIYYKVTGKQVEFTQGRNQFISEMR